MSCAIAATAIRRHPLSDNEAGAAKLSTMTTRERLHRLVDELPDERLAEALLALAPLDDEPVTVADRSAIEEAEADVRAGRVFTLDEIRGG